MQFLSVAPDLIFVRTVFKKATNAVSGAISKKALNFRQGAKHIPPQLLPCLGTITTTSSIKLTKENQFHPSDI